MLGLLYNFVLSTEQKEARLGCNGLLVPFAQTENRKDYAFAIICTSD
jgi:hypothetical protein